MPPHVKWALPFSAFSRNQCNRLKAFANQKIPCICTILSQAWKRVKKHGTSLDFFKSNFGIAMLFMFKHHLPDGHRRNLQASLHRPHPVDPGVDREKQGVVCATFSLLFWKKKKSSFRSDIQCLISCKKQPDCNVAMVTLHACERGSEVVELDVGSNGVQAYKRKGHPGNLSINCFFSLCFKIPTFVCSPANNYN